MNPTPEQVAAWAREADKHAAHKARGMVEFYKLRDAHLITRAMAEQAEADAKLCGQVGARQTEFEASDCAAAISANAPKVTT